MDWLMLPLVFLAAAFCIHGFPDIKIGGKHEYHYHNNEDEDEFEQK
ncbi:MAG: hypothetical protein QM791_04035 [Ferruginibacter sp.]